MKKLLYMLCMGALIFIGCNQFSLEKPEDEFYEGLITADILTGYCIIYPTSEVCTSMKGKTEVTLQDAKPVMKLTLSGGKMLYGATDPVAWDRGFFNVKSSDQSNGIAYIENFSVESGSIIPANTGFKSFAVWDVGYGFSRSESYSVTSSTEGGDQLTKGPGYNSTFKGVTVSRVAVFDSLNKYLYLPQLHFKL